MGDEGGGWEAFLDRHERRLRFDSWASLEHGFLYLATPKVACTKVKKLLQGLVGLPVPDGTSAIHQRADGAFVGNLLDHRPEERVHLLTAPEVTRFCFVRDPYTRIRSAYANKVVGPVPYQGGRRQIWDARPAADADRPPTLGEFLAIVRDLPDRRRDPHWRSQVAIVHPDRIDYDVIGRFERFAADMDGVLDRLGAPVSVRRDLAVRENPSPPIADDGPGLDWFRDEDGTDVVAEAYPLDFDTFGYDRA